MACNVATDRYVMGHPKVHIIYNITLQDYITQFKAYNLTLGRFHLAGAYEEYDTYIIVSYYIVYIISLYWLLTL